MKRSIRVTLVPIHDDSGKIVEYKVSAALLDETGECRGGTYYPLSVLSKYMLKWLLEGKNK